MFGSWLNILTKQLSKYLPRSYTPLVLFVFGILVTLETTYLLTLVLQDRQEVLFNNAVSRTESIVTDYVDLYGVMLRSTKGLFMVDSNVTAPEFKAFVDQLRLTERYPGIAGLAYSTKFTPAERSSMPARLRELGVVNWKLYPETERSEYHTIIFLEPRDVQSTVVGFDMFTESTRREAMEQARDTGRLVLSGNITLVQSENNTTVKGFLMYLPVYRYGSVPSSVEERRELLEGFVYAPFRSEDFFKAVFQSEKTAPLVNVSVYDGTQTDTDKLLYTSQQSSENYKPKHSTTRQMEVGGHTWTVVYTNKPEFEVFERRELIIFLLAGGLISSFLLFIVSKKQVDARTRAEHSEEELLASQEKLKASEERFRLMVEGAQDFAIMQLDTQGRITSWNIGAEKMFGYSEDEILHQHFSIFFRPEDQKQGVPERELQRVLSFGRSEDENWAVQKDGSYMWVSGTSSAIYDKEGEFRGIVKIARDLSLRKKTEEALRKNEALTQAVLQSLPSFIMVLDQNAKIIAINEAGNSEENLRTEFLKNFKGRRNYLELMKKFTELDIATRRKIIAGVQAVLEGKKAEFKMEYSVQIEGVETWLLMQLTPLKYSNSGIVISHRDITDRKNLDKQKDEFISIASHELKTPITSIKAYTQVLQTLVKDLKNEKFDKILGRVDAQVNRLTTLVTDLLDVSKVESGQLQLNNVNFNFDELVSEIVESMQFTTQTHTLKSAGITKASVYGDRERISQVLINLISNAIKYSPHASTVEIFTSVERKEGTRSVKFSVQDFGVGIPKTQQKKIFDRFYRATPSAKFSGLGLGLYISAQIVKRHGGKIWVENSTEKGSKFSFTLPVQKAAPASAKKS